LWDERWVGTGVRPWKRGGEDAPADIPVYRHWVLLASQMMHRVMADLDCMTRSRVLCNVMQNNSNVEEPQYLSDFRISWQKQT